MSGSSIVSSPSSRRNSLGGSISEHALSETLSEHIPSIRNTATLVGSSGAPQLVMPSIEMPTRRRFTETGKNMGRLKILLAGDSGIGKTSLIKSIAQCCEHLVHVDPILPHPQLLRRHSGAVESEYLRPTTGVVEILASTKPYPEWWSELDVSSSSRRRSMGDGVLDRNICFVDTPGYGRGSSSMETIVSCVEYVEADFNKMASDSLNDTELLSMLGGAGACQTDVVLYMVAQQLKPADLEYMRRLSQLTNVIPILSRVDTMSSQQIESCKNQITGQIQDAGIRTFTFDSRSAPACAPATPYAVSSAKGSDHETMDASLLMSSHYVEPLMGTELLYVVDKIFSVEGASWLRHASARKYVDWRSASPPRPRHLYKPLNAPGPSTSDALVRYAGRSGDLVRIPESTAQEPRFKLDEGTRLYVADWAADLQRSLAAEKDQCLAMPRSCDVPDLRDRAVISTSGPDRNGHVQQRRAQRSDSGRVKQKPAKRTVIKQDPLGLLQVSADLKASSWVALELLGSLGLLSGLALWFSRHHWHSDPVLLVDDWARVWSLDF